MYTADVAQHFDVRPSTSTLAAPAQGLPGPRHRAVRTRERAAAWTW